MYRNIIISLNALAYASKIKNVNNTKQMFVDSLYSNFSGKLTLHDPCSAGANWQKIELILEDASLLPSALLQIIEANG